MLGLLPPPVLALVASHLSSAVTLLHLQRCSSTLYSLRSDELYMAVAWRWAELRLSSAASLYDWTLPASRCIADGLLDSPQRTLIPLRLWKEALPAFREVLLRTSERWAGDDSHALLRELVGQAPLTEWMRDQPSSVWTAEELAALFARDEELLEEVLRNVDRETLLRAEVADHRTDEVRCRLALRACPYLQHVHVVFNTMCTAGPWQLDTFALLPRLRSLHTSHTHSAAKPVIEHFDFEWKRLLPLLPHLSSLHLQQPHLNLHDLFYIACHSTLEDLQISTRGQQLDHSRHYHQIAHAAWLGLAIELPVDELTDRQHLLQEARLQGPGCHVEEQRDEQLLDAAAQAETARLLGSSRMDEREWAKMSTFMTKEERRMSELLVRTHPTRRSCEVRLELAEWLHRRLRRGGLNTDKPLKPELQLRAFRYLVFLLRRTLQQQLAQIATTAQST